MRSYTGTWEQFLTGDADMQKQKKMVFTSKWGATHQLTSKKKSPHIKHTQNTKLQCARCAYSISM